MSSIRHLRALINERLTAAAEEIFIEFEKTIVQYEDVIDRQRRLLEITWRPEIGLHTGDLPQQHAHEENVLADQNLCNQERDSSLDQEDPEPEELSTSQEGELVLMQEADVLVQSKSKCEERSREVLRVFEKTEFEKNIIQVNEEIDRQRRPRDIIWKPQPLQIKDEQEEPWSSLDQENPPEPPESDEEQQELCISGQGEQSIQKQGTGTFLLTSVNENNDHDELEPSSEQFLSYNLPVDESPHQEGSNHVASQLKVHMMLHKDQKEVSCKTCGKHFTCRSSLNVHMRTHTGEKPYPCVICGKSFSQSYNLTIHMRTHTGEKSYPCETCGKSFRRSDNLNVHMRIHTGEKCYSCETCGKSFSQRINLTEHMRTHTGEKPYPCETCGKSFSQRINLTVHMRTHTGEKPYPCETCGKSFTQRIILTEHMRTHTGETLFSCKTCGKKFSRGSSLTVHMRSHTGEKPYFCGTCCKSFSTNSNLNVHMRTHKGKKLSPKTSV